MAWCRRKPWTAKVQCANEEFHRVVVLVWKDWKDCIKIYWNTETNAVWILHCLACWGLLAIFDGTPHWKRDTELHFRPHHKCHQQQCRTEGDLRCGGQHFQELPQTKLLKTQNVDWKYNIARFSEVKHRISVLDPCVCLHQNGQSNCIAFSSTSRICRIKTSCHSWKTLFGQKLPWALKSKNTLFEKYTISASLFVCLARLTFLKSKPRRESILLRQDTSRLSSPCRSAPQVAPSGLLDVECSAPAMSLTPAGRKGPRLSSLPATAGVIYQ